MTLTYIALLLGLATFSLYGYFSSYKVNSYRSFFHRSERRESNTSAVFANVTLGTGLVYLAATYQQLGLWSLLIVLGGALGYLFLSWFSKKVPAFTPETPNFYSLLNTIVRPVGKFKFGTCVIVIVAFTYMLLLSYELALSSKFLFGLLFGSNDAVGIFIFSILLLVFIAAYTVLGGIRAVYKTDMIQAAFILISLIAVIIAILVVEPNWQLNIADASIKPFPKSLTGLLATQVFLGFCTQIYSIVNWGVASNHDQASNSEGFIVIGLGVVLSSTILLVIGAPITPSIDPISDIMIKLYSSNSALITFAVAPIIMLGFLSILITTIDTLIIMVAMILTDEFNKPGNSQSSESKGLKNVRVLIVASMFFPACISAYLIFMKPDLIQALLIVTSALALLSPTFIAIILANRAKGFNRIDNWLAYIMLIVFATVFSMGAFTLFTGGDSSQILLIGIIVSVVIALIMSRKPIFQFFGLSSEQPSS